MDVSKLVRKNIKDLNSIDLLEMNSHLNLKNLFFSMQMKILMEKN